MRTNTTAAVPNASSSCVITGTYSHNPHPIRTDRQRWDVLACRSPQLRWFLPVLCEPADGILVLHTIPCPSQARYLTGVERYTTDEWLLRSDDGERVGGSGPERLDVPSSPKFVH